MKRSLIWPKFCQRVVKALVRLVLKEDFDRLKSASVASQLKLLQLWAASTRVWELHSQVADDKERIEWTDLQDALQSVKSKHKAA